MYDCKNVQKMYKKCKKKTDINKNGYAIYVLWFLYLIMILQECTRLRL